jgi:ABC-type branched-subunit amino acid transport system ATPase component
MSEPHLRLDDLSIHFGGLKAVDGLSLEVQRGNIDALLGPNGAGKTTTFNGIMGIQRLTRGRVYVNGIDLTGKGPQARASASIGRTFQNLSLVPHLTVEENVAVGVIKYRSSGLLGAMLRTPRTRREDRETKEISYHALDFVGLTHLRWAKAGALSYGDRRRLEIARALASGPKLLLLDEPSAGMGARETLDLADLVAHARDTFGLTVLVIEHDMDFVRKVAQHTSVIDFGRLIASGKTADVLADPVVVHAYLGAPDDELEELADA